jgi:hypothetical protein
MTPVTATRDLSQEKGYDHNDPRLRTGAGGLTVWTLQNMAQKNSEELDELFDNGVTLNALPVGLAAGTAARVFDFDNKLISELLDCITGKSWRGKVFFISKNKRVSQGRNRIRESMLIPNSRIVPMCKFVTKLLDSHPLAPRAKSNVVILNYADSLTRPYLFERLVSKVPVYDVQVAVPGKYGPVYIGKTWYGKYDKTNGEFIASDPDKLIARYFLDFNPEAIKEQKEKHWDGGEEDLLDPIPEIDD